MNHLALLVFGFLLQNELAAAYAFFMMAVGAITSFLGAIDAIASIVDRIRGGRRNSRFSD